MSDADDTEAWWRLLESDPLEAMESPLFGLLTLEDPARYQETEASEAISWVCATVGLLNGNRQWLLWRDSCGEFGVEPHAIRDKHNYKRDGMHWQAAFSELADKHADQLEDKGENDEYWEQAYVDVYISVWHRLLQHLKEQQEIGESE